MIIARVGTRSLVAPPLFMKRFFNFLLFVALLALAVGSLQLWKDRRSGRRRWENPFAELFGSRSAEHRTPEKYTLAAGPRVDLKDVDVLAAMSRQRVVLARAVVPSVVSIVTSKTVDVPDYQQDPVYQLFHHRAPAGRGGGSRVANQLGSGAIISPEGHIVTNNHVIDGMDQIAVKLSDGREREARLVGTDKDTDIAVLKIDADSLMALPFGDSELVEVGETVMAVGNPYGWEESVTQGIISAKGRRGSENVSDLFQIDAAINPGNSGGPLINVRGELIGINEMIYSRTGGWQGVGFAIPAGTVRRVVDGILKSGRVIHGYLGIERALIEGSGVLVNSVRSGSPAEKAAIQPGDVIEKFNGKPVNDFDDLKRSIAEVNVDSTVPVQLLRGGKTLSVNAKIAEKPPEDVQLSQVPPVPPGSRVPGLPPGHPPINGGSGRALVPPPGSLVRPNTGLLSPVVVRELSGGDVAALKMPENARGVLVASVRPETPAAEALQPGDVIETINQEPVANAADYARLLRSLPADQMIVLSIIRERSRTVVTLSPE